MFVSAGDLASRIAQKVALKKSGNRWLGLCPFHHETTPSFTVFQGRDGKARWYCFGCQERGDIFDWIRRVEGGTGRELGFTPDLDARRRYAEEKRRERALQQFRDRNPDSCIPDNIFLED